MALSSIPCILSLNRLSQKWGSLQTLLKGFDTKLEITLTKPSCGWYKGRIIMAWVSQINSTGISRVGSLLRLHPALGRLVLTLDKVRMGD